MSRIAKWKLEKAKVKVVFRLQFHATHIPQTGWDKLFISFVPADSAKATAKTSKSNVRNGSCKWADPIYETTRLLQDTKTKQYDEKLYKLVVAMGSSRSSLLGEANINLAEYADASKPYAVALPLHGCNYGTVLHVTVQLLTSKTGFREFEQQRELRERGLQMTTNQNIHDAPAEKLSASADFSSDQIDKVNSRVRFKSESRELPSLEEEVGLNEDYADSTMGIDDSSNTSESLYADKHDSSTHEIDSLKSTISGDLGGLSLSQSPRPEKGDPSDHRLLAQGTNDWVHGWSSDYSMDNDLATAYEENIRLRGSLEVAESSMMELKLEVSSLQSHADHLGAETQKFSQLLAAEITSGEELANEVAVLKSECSKFKDDVEQLKHSRLSHYSRSGETVEKDQVHLFQDLQMRWLQGLLVMEDKVREVQNKACLRYDEVGFTYFLPDIEVLQHVLQDLKQGMTQVISQLNVEPGERAAIKKIGAMPDRELELSVPGDGLEAINVDQYDYECIFPCVIRPDQSQEPDPVDGTTTLKDKICDLQRELDDSKTEQDGLRRKMDQMECYYEALIQELEDNQKQMLGELQNLRNEHSNGLYTISSCKTQMEKMHQDMSEQFLRFSEDRCALESLNKELEKRAIAAETALKRARWNHSIAVDQLQKDLELLSFQVLSMFETNENLIRQTFEDASQACFQEYLDENSESIDSCLQKDYASFLQKQYKTRVNEIQAEVNAFQKTEQVLASDQVASLQKLTEEKKNVEVHANLVVEAHRDLDSLDSSKRPQVELPDKIFMSNLDSLDFDTAKLLQCQNDNAELKRQIVGGEILLDDLRRSLNFREELYQKAESELLEMHAINIHLDVFSKVLLENLYEANNDFEIMKEKRDELARQIAHSTESKELLMLKLQTALDEVDTLRECQANCITKCDELAFQNQVLEEKFQGIFNENHCLTQKVTEYERMTMEYGIYKSKYEACTAERTELVNLLKLETLEKYHLENEVNFVHEELKTLKADFDEQSSVKGNLEKTVSFLQDRLGDLRSTMLSYNEQIYGSSLLCKPAHQELENFTSTILNLEELQKKAYEKILQLTHEKKDVEEQRDIAQGSLSSKVSEILLVKQKYESDMQDMVTKLDASNAHVEKLQLELENVAKKLKISSEAEERFAVQSKEISSKLTVLEVELQHVTAENGDLAQKILALESVNRELESAKLSVVDSTRENQSLMKFLRAGNEESVHLTNELRCIKDNLRCMNDELCSEKGLRNELECTIADLTSQLNMKNDLLLSFDKEKAELVHLKQLVSDLEVEKSRVCHHLSCNEECLRKADENASSLHLQITDLETYLAESHEYILAADVELTCTRNQFQIRMQELVQQLESLDRCYRELHLKHLDVLTTLNGRISSEAQYVEENARLLAVLNSLRYELEATITEKSALLDQNNVISVELEKYKMRAVIAESDIQEKYQLELQIEQLKHELLSTEEAIDNLKASRDELEIAVIVLRTKFDECCVQTLLLEENVNELTMLRNQKNELAQRLAEQILKTEEFKNLSIHLKELKDKADAGCLQAREKRETEGPSVAMQESLRMAFVREQCETKLQEVRSQLYASKKHGEEMLLKLQDALDEVETRKKSEASHIKRNEELSLKILELETDLQTAIADKREKVKACDRMKAELECSLISLDCCKEEKQKLEASFQECMEERTKISVELSSMKEHLERSASPTNIQEKGNVKPHTLEPISTEEVNKEASCNEEYAYRVPMQAGLISRSVVEISRQALVDQEDLRQLSLINECVKAQTLKSSMDHLHKELERMKNDNSTSLPPQDLDNFEPAFQGLQRELLQLHLANEQLGIIFPLFNEIPGSGNALERVLALEIELAEALKAKKKSNVHFQSSFLKQHSDEEAIFQSFRDINELIRDMLELKEKYTTVETELKEMHDRYSQLSLQFAEVEGERQKLVMTLKNSKVAKKRSHRSTSASLDDNS